MDAADVPELQIIPDDTWKAAQDRLNAIRGRMNGVGGGRRRRDIDSEHLLPGFARCAVCGGGLGVITRDGGKGRPRTAFYGCVAYQKGRTTVCRNNLVVRMENVDAAVLETLAGKVLRPQVIDAVIAGVKRAMKPASITGDIQRRRAEVSTLEKEIGRLTEAIAASATTLPTLLEALQTRQQAP
jgi:site-specific DNA recombinase